MRVALISVFTACTMSCAAAHHPPKAQVEAPVRYYTIPLSAPADVIICVELPSHSFGHDNISGEVACGFSVGELRELYIRQKRS